MQLGISEVVATLQNIPVDQFAPGEVCRRLRHAAVEPSTLEPYLHREPTGYTRNLIYRSELFELLALCWEPHSESFVHDHSGQLCWLSIQRGGLRLENFHSLDGPGPGTNIRLVRRGGLARAEAGCLDLRHGEDGIHRVSNPFDEPAISLHVYSRPFDTCVAYDLEKRIAREIPLRYHSVLGKCVTSDPHPRS